MPRKVIALWNIHFSIRKFQMNFFTHLCCRLTWKIYWSGSNPLIKLLNVPLLFSDGQWCRIKYDWSCFFFFFFHSGVFKTKLWMTYGTEYPSASETASNYQSQNLMQKLLSCLTNMGIPNFRNSQNRSDTNICPKQSLQCVSNLGIVVK